MEGAGDICFTGSRPALGPTQTHIQWLLESLFLEVKRPGREPDHSPLSSAKAKKDGAMPPLPRTSPWSDT
jgi:hypothetical protein